MTEHQTNHLQESEVDTDSSENRLKRAINHYNFEQTDLPYSFGKNFKDRVTNIRLSLFKGFANINGENFQRLLSDGQILSDHRAQIDDEFLPTNEAAAAALEKYIPLMDQLYNQIKDIPDINDKEEATFRFLSTMFVGGILIHPFGDGNGQTFKAMVLSYMHDLLPHYQDRFVPIKYSNIHHYEPNEMSTLFIGGRFLAESEDLNSGPVPKLEPKSERDKHLLDLLEQLTSVRKRIPLKSEEFYRQREKQISQEIHLIKTKIENTLGIKNIAETEVITYRQEKRFGIFPRRVPVYLPVDVAIQKGCEKYLKDQRYPQEQIDVTVYPGIGKQMHRASNTIRQLITTEAGRKLIKDYVLTGKAEISDDDTPNNILFRKAIKTFDKQKAKIIETLETKPSHEKRHQEMLEFFSLALKSN